MLAEPARRYTVSASFTHANVSIHTLALSSTGNLLASGATDGTLRVWDIKSRKELPSESGSYGAISCAIWIRTKYAATETLCYGTVKGFLVFLRSSPVMNRYQEICKQKLGAGFEITCIAYDPAWSKPGARVVVGMRDSVIEILQLNTNSQLEPVFSGRMNCTIPKSVAFSQRSSNIVYIFGLYDGKVIKMKADGKILNEHQYDSVIGNASISPKKELVVIDNASNGFTLYSLDDATPIRYFITDPPSVTLPKQVAFGEDSRLVVGGSDNGSIYLFERRTGDLLTKLVHSTDGLVQTIAVRDADGHCIIASASPAQGRRKALVRVWTYHYAAERMTKVVKSTSNWTSFLKFLVLLLVSGILVSWNAELFDPGQYIDWVENVQLPEQWCGYLMTQCSTHTPPAQFLTDEIFIQKLKTYDPGRLRALAAHLDLRREPKDDQTKLGKTSGIIYL